MPNNGTCDGTTLYENVVCYFDFWPSLALAIVALSCFGVAGIIVSVVRQSSSDLFCTDHHCHTLMLGCSFDALVQQYICAA